MTHTTQVLSERQIKDLIDDGLFLDTPNAIARAIESATLNAVSGQEPIGYFRALPFGWEDCAEFDEGAMPLFALPPAQPAPVDEREALRVLLAAVDAEMSDEWTCNSYHPSLVSAAYQARAALQCAQAPQATSEAQTLHECVACKHLYQEKPSSCDCMENDSNEYREWVATPAPQPTKGQP